MNATVFFEDLLKKRAAGRRAGICSVCSAHPVVLRAAMENARAAGLPVLIEATSNQVNQHGGYTGMTPADFYDFVAGIAAGCGFPMADVILGGDHLGPFVWRNKPTAEAMALSVELVEAYAAAGFTKIHLDTSMRLADDDPGAPLTDETIAARGALLCQAAERGYARRKAADPVAARPAARSGSGAPLAGHPSPAAGASCSAAPSQLAAQSAPPVYVIGSEVPTPGGPQDGEDTVTPTAPSAFLAAYRTFEAAFAAEGLQEAFSRIVAFVVQPGVEFTGDTVFDYDHAAAVPLLAALKEVGRPLVFEGHSTDYQPPAAMRQLVEDGVAILKVGPALTFALREGLFALEAMEKELLAGTAAAPSGFAAALEAAMLADDSHWKAYYKGDARQQALLRRYSYFDRARYYLALPAVANAAETLMVNLEKTGLPLNMLSQFLPACYADIRAGRLEAEPRAILRACVRHALKPYDEAVL